MAISVEFNEFESMRLVPSMFLLSSPALVSRSRNRQEPENWFSRPCSIVLRLRRSRMEYGNIALPASSLELSLGRRTDLPIGLRNDGDMSRLLVSRSSDTRFSTSTIQIEWAFCLFYHIQSLVMVRGHLLPIAAEV